MELLAQWLWVGMSDYGGKVEDNGVVFFFLFSFFSFLYCFLLVMGCGDDLLSSGYG